MKAHWLIGSITFACAASACVMVTSSYPVAIWAVGFAALLKASAKPHDIQCPMLEAAAAKERDV